MPRRLGYCQLECLGVSVSATKDAEKWRSCLEDATCECVNYIVENELMPQRSFIIEYLIKKLYNLRWWLVFKMHRGKWWAFYIKKVVLLFIFRNFNKDSLALSIKIICLHQKPDFITVYMFISYIIIDSFKTCAPNSFLCKKKHTEWNISIIFVPLYSHSVITSVMSQICWQTAYCHLNNNDVWVDRRFFHSSTGDDTETQYLSMT